jgi:hypothetical protein
LPIVCTWSLRHSATETLIDPPEDRKVADLTDLTKVTIKTAYTSTSRFDRLHGTTARIDRSIQVPFRNTL